jgi:hypothetical protein
MKTRFLILIILFIIPSLIFTQCPGPTAINYKDKAKNLGADEFSKQQAYIWLATYYAYKCECETGSPRSEQLVGMINRIVDTYSAYTKNAYGSISKVSTCKSQDGNGNSETTEDTGDPNASNHGSGKYFKVNSYDLENLSREILGDSSIVTQNLRGFNLGKDLGESFKSGDNISENLENTAMFLLGDDSEITNALKGYNTGKKLYQGFKDNDLSAVISALPEAINLIWGDEKQREARLARRREKLKERLALRQELLDDKYRVSRYANNTIESQTYSNGDGTDTKTFFDSNGKWQSSIIYKNEEEILMEMKHFYNTEFKDPEYSIVIYYETESIEKWYYDSEKNVIKKEDLVANTEIFKKEDLKTDEKQDENGNKIIEYTYGDYKYPHNVQIFDINGQLLQMITKNPENGQIQIEIDFQTGIEFYYDSKGEITKKVISHKKIKKGIIKTVIQYKNGSPHIEQSIDLSGRIKKEKKLK